jgi:MerR family transcriptional regulator, light-induced transcriptional regulator
MALFNSSLETIRWSLAAQGSKLSGLAHRVLKTSKKVLLEDELVPGFPLLDPSSPNASGLSSPPIPGTAGVASPQAGIQAKDKLTLLRTIEERVIPTLAARRGLGSVSGLALVGVWQESFLQALLANDKPHLQTMLLRLLAQGWNHQQIHQHLVEHSAHQLGVKWAADEVNTAELTLGMANLHQIVNEFSLNLPPDTVLGQGQSLRVLMTVLPENHHGLGNKIVAQAMLAQGWDVTSLMPQSASELLAGVGTQRFDLIGLSVGCQVHLHGLARLIEQIRATSQKHDVVVMVGGPVFVQNPHWAIEVGADGTAADAQQAVTLATQLCRARVHLKQ